MERSEVIAEGRIVTADVSGDAWHVCCRRREIQIQEWMSVTLALHKWKSIEQQGKIHFTFTEIER